MIYFAGLMVILAVIATSLWWLQRADRRERMGAAPSAKPGASEQR
jgi:hypothetical protein